MFLVLHTSAHAHSQTHTFIHIYAYIHACIQHTYMSHHREIEIRTIQLHFLSPLQMLPPESLLKWLYRITTALLNARVPSSSSSSTGQLDWMPLRAEHPSFLPWFLLYRFRHRNCRCAVVIFGRLIHIDSRNTVIRFWKPVRLVYNVCKASWSILSACSLFLHSYIYSKRSLVSQPCSSEPPRHSRPHVAHATPPSVPTFL